MNFKEIGEIRRRVRRDRSNMTEIFGCYVNAQKEIVSTFSQSVGIMPENEAEKYFGVLKKVLSGGIGKNLIDIAFKTSQVADSPEHKLLMQLRETKLKNEDVRMEFFRKVISSVTIEDNYLILIGCDSYDVPFKSKDDTVQADASDETYTYLLCAICPVKQAKANLRYNPESKEFHDGGLAHVVSAPELGFLFPAFDGRGTNIYNSLFYTRNTKLGHNAFIETIYNTAVPKPAAEQKKSFEALLGRSLGDACNMDVVQTVHDEICQSIAMHKESKIPDPLLISKDQLTQTLKSCGVPEKNVAKFSVDYDSEFGFDAQLHPGNIINKSKFSVETPDVSIKVNPARTDLIETRVIGGVKYILICADENVEVNGVNIHIDDGKVTE